MIISSETSSNDGITNTAHKQSINATVLDKDKQLPLTVRKTTLSDVRNQDSGLSKKTTESFNSLVGGLEIDSATKVNGFKRPTPEPPSFYHALDHKPGNENIMNAWRRFESELGGGKKLRHIDSALVKFSDSRQTHNPLGEHAWKTNQPTTNSDSRQTQNSLGEHAWKTNHPTTNNSLGEHAWKKNHPTTNSDSRQTHNSLGEHARKTNQPTTNYMSSSQEKLRDGPSALSFLSMYGSETEATHVDSVKPNVKCHDSISFEGYDDLQWREQLERLQKRAIELTIEEGKELHRMKCMNILGTSFQTNNNIWHHYLQARK